MIPNVVRDVLGNIFDFLQPILDVLEDIGVTQIVRDLLGTN
jgi:hypothetical protein